MNRDLLERAPMTILDDDVPSPKTIPEQPFKGEPHCRPGFPDPNNVEGVILAQVICAIGHVELIALPLHMRANGFAGIDCLERSLENRV
jgi:hypothetical protein